MWAYDEECDADTLAKLGIERPPWATVRLRVGYDDATWDDMGFEGRFVHGSAGWSDHPPKPAHDARKLDSDRHGVTWFVPPNREELGIFDYHRKNGASRKDAADAHNAAIAGLVKMARRWHNGDAYPVFVQISVMFDGIEAGSATVGGVVYDVDTRMAALALEYAADHGLASEALDEAEHWHARTVRTLTGVGG